MFTYGPNTWESRAADGAGAIAGRFRWFANAVNPTTGAVNFRVSWIDNAAVERAAFDINWVGAATARSNADALLAGFLVGRGVVVSTQQRADVDMDRGVITIIEDEGPISITENEGETPPAGG